MNWIILVAVLSPFIYGLANVFDKYVVSRKIKSPTGYAVISGITTIILGLIIGIFLSWNNLLFASLIFPILAGIFSGLCYYFYFIVMKHSDASYVIGLAYLFPVVVAILSFFFLNERLSILSYFAIILILTGAILLSIRAKKIKLKIIFLPFIAYIILLGFYEFSIKVSTLHLSFIHGLVITMIVSGIIILMGLFNRKIRSLFIKEIINFKWAFLGESITLGGLLTLYLAMANLHATIVSSIGAIQPLVVILFERFAHLRFGKITEDLKLLPKLKAILLIVIGVIILSLINS